MTSTGDAGSTDYHARAADSAACLLVVGAYEEYSDILRRVVTGVQQRILMSPTLGDFFQVRFGELGPRPSEAGRGTPEVARLVLQLTSRPGDAARNFSALLVFDQSATVVDRLLRACANDPALNQLNTRCLGMASREDRVGRAPGDGSSQSRDDIAIARHGGRHVEDFVTEIYSLAEGLLDDFGSGWKPGVRPEEVSRLRSIVKPAARGVIAKATAVEDARFAQQQSARRAAEPSQTEREAESRKQAERKVLADREAAAWEMERAAQRAEASLRAEAERLAAAKRQIAELEAQVADLKRSRDVAATPPGADKPASGGVAPEAGRPKHDPEPERSRRTAPASAEVPADPGTNMAAETSSDGDASNPQTGSSARRWQRIKGVTDAAKELASRVRDPQASGPAEASKVVGLLSQCAQRLRAADLNGVRDSLNGLRRHAGTEINQADRERYRMVMIEDRLLSHSLPPDTLAVEFYDVLLRLAYGQPLGYGQYCDLEHSLVETGTSLLPQPLLRAIEGAYPTDPLVLAITRHYAGRRQGNEKIRPRPGDTRRLIMALAEIPLAEGHVNILFGMLTRYLSEVRTSPERKEITSLLGDHGYLSVSLNRSCRDAVPDQVAKLITLLNWAYPEGLDSAAIETVIGAGKATSALLAAILFTLARPSDRPRVIQEFLRRYQGRNIDAAQAAELEPEIMRLSLSGGGSAGEITAGP
jgi:hypothetical protein